MRKEGDRLIIEPTPPKSLLPLLATLEPLDDEFATIPELELDPVELCCATCSIPTSSRTSCANPQGRGVILLRRRKTPLVEL